jgi:hypothetical protein
MRKAVSSIDAGLSLLSPCRSISSDSQFLSPESHSQNLALFTPSCHAYVSLFSQAYHLTDYKTQDSCFRKGEQSCGIVENAVEKSLLYRISSSMASRVFAFAKSNTFECRVLCGLLEQPSIDAAETLRLAAAGPSRLANKLLTNRCLLYLDRADFFILFSSLVFGAATERKIFFDHKKDCCLIPRLGFLLKLRDNSFCSW